MVRAWSRIGGAGVEGAVGGGATLALQVAARKLGLIQ